MQSILKAKADKPFPVGYSPYLHSRQSTSKILWGTLAALPPIMIGSFIFFGWNALRIYAVAISSGLLFEYLFELITGQKSRIHDGSTVLISVLFSFLMPPNVPLGVIIFGIFTAVLLGKELFGGLGQNLFHPVLVGYASVLSLFPREMLIPSQIQVFNPSFFWWSQSPMLGTGSGILILISGLFLMFKKFVRLENVLFYFASSFLSLTSLDFHPLDSASFLVLISFFFMTDPGSGPITKAGRVVFSVTAGLLTAAFFSWMNLYQAAASAILISNSAAPLMDQFIRSVSNQR